jgi:cytochrome oxidase assembly protein ShyY1
VTTAQSGTLGTDPRPRSARWVAVGTAALLGAVALLVGGTLGTWQWDRAHQQASAIEPDPPAPVADVMRPAESGRGEGRLVEVTGTWADADVALVPGKEVDGQDAVLLVMPLEVPAELTGTGQAATLPVLMGWKSAAEVVDVPRTGGAVSVSGYVRGGEGSEAPPDLAPIESAFWLGSMATAALAQEWPAPVYSYLVVADTAPPGWNPMPPPADQSRLDIRSVTYAAEWWLFGIFGALLAGRFIRDNMRAPRTEEDT